MWNYVLRHRLLLRAIYSRSTPLLGDQVPDRGSRIDQPLACGWPPA